MNDLVKCLYEFMITKRLGSVWDDPEYTEISAQNSIESEHRFQASLGLARELSALVRAGRGV